MQLVLASGGGRGAGLRSGLLQGGARWWRQVKQRRHAQRSCRQLAAGRAPRRAYRRRILTALAPQVPQPSIIGEGLTGGSMAPLVMGLVRSSSRPKSEGTLEKAPPPCTSVKQPRRRNGEGCGAAGPASGVSGVPATMTCSHHRRGERARSAAVQPGGVGWRQVGRHGCAGCLHQQRLHAWPLPTPLTLPSCCAAASLSARKGERRPAASAERTPVPAAAGGVCCCTGSIGRALSLQAVARQHAMAAKCGGQERREAQRPGVWGATCRRAVRPPGAV